MKNRIVEGFRRYEVGVEYDDGTSTVHSTHDVVADQQKTFEDAVIAALHLQHNNGGDILFKPLQEQNEYPLEDFIANNVYKDGRWISRS